MTDTLLQEKPGQGQEAQEADPDFSTELKAPDNMRAATLRDNQAPETDRFNDAFSGDRSDRSSANLNNITNINRVSPEHQQQISEILASVSPDQTAEAGRAIAQILQRKELSKSQLEAVLEQIHQIADPDNSLATGLDNQRSRSEAITSLLNNIAQPDQIHQSSKATCPATEVERNLCKTEPEEYARLVSELLRSGKTNWADGSRLDLNQTALEREAPEAGQPLRGLSSRIFQACAMDYANGTDSYSNHSDFNAGSQPPAYKGLYKEQWQLLHNVAFNTGSNRIHTGNLDVTTDKDGNPLEMTEPADLLRIMDQHKHQNGGVMCEIHQGDIGDHSLHCVTYLGTVSKGGSEYVVVHNPWNKEANAGVGGRMLIEKNVFLSQLTCALIDDPERNVLEVDREPNWKYAIEIIDGIEVINTLKLAADKPKNDLDQSSSSLEEKQRMEDTERQGPNNNDSQPITQGRGKITRQSALFEAIQRDDRKRRKSS